LPFPSRPVSSYAGLDSPEWDLSNWQTLCSPSGRKSRSAIRHSASARGFLSSPVSGHVQAQHRSVGQTPKLLSSMADDFAQLTCNKGNARM
jgi:hypothetical protein